jgi:serine/threonine-protein kinase
MGEVVNTARIGERMNELFREEIRAGPRLDTRIQVPPKKDGTSDAEVARPSLPANATEKISTLSSDEANAMLAEQARAATGPVPLARPAPEAERRRGLGWVWLLAGVLVCGAIGAGIAIAVRPPDPTATSPTPPIAPPTPPPVRAPPPVVAPAPATATLFVDSTPGGATVTLGTRGVVGTTPLELGLLEPGEWNVRLHLEEHEDWEDTVELRGGERLRVFGELRPIRRAGRPTGRDPGETRVEPPPAAEPGRLSLNTRPWSRVYLGSRLLGTTPLGDVELPSGTARLRLVDRDGVEHTRTVGVPPGGHVREFFDLSSDPGEGPAP